MQQHSLIRMADVVKRTGYGRQWIYKLIKAGQFPHQIKIGSRSIAFIESEVDAWVSNKIEKSRAGEVV